MQYYVSKIWHHRNQFAITDIAEDGVFVRLLRRMITMMTNQLDSPVEPGNDSVVEQILRSA